MAEQVVVTIPRERVREVTPAEALGAALKIREELRKAVQQAWNSREGVIVKDQLASAAYKTGFSEGMEAIMAGVANDIKKLAERTIKEAYKEVWGKPTRR